MTPVVVDISIAAAPERVWRALRAPEEIGRWHGWEYEGLEAEIAAIYLDEVEESEAELSLETGAGRFQLEPADGGTRLLVTRPAPEGRADWSGVHDEINEGWLTFAQQLRYYLERHPGEDRRSLVLGASVPPPAGEGWFESEHQSGVAVGEHSLVVVTPDRTIISTY